MGKKVQQVKVPSNWDLSFPKSLPNTFSHFNFSLVLIGLLFLLVVLPVRWNRRENAKSAIKWFSRYLTRGGYVLRKYSSGSGRGRLEHRIIAEEILGRRLERWEVVHHINGRRADNSVENLCVMSRYGHDQYHKWYDWVRSKGNFPRKETQLRKLREDFGGTLLSDVLKRKSG